MELRVLAQLSEDDALKQDFAAGRDVHEATARQLLDKQPEVNELPTHSHEKRLAAASTVIQGTERYCSDFGISRRYMMFCTGSPTDV
jgi:DNA polymerase I-like protein with 3'-5' exonuclease and polymerase domains